MIKKNNCILCKSKVTVVNQIIDKNELIELYLKEYNSDVSHIIEKNIEYIHCNNCDLYYFHPAFIGDEKFYNSLQKLTWYYQDYKYEYDFVANFIKENNNILEIGCGKAAFTKYLKENVNYTGLDFSIEAKNMASINGIKIENISVHELAKNNIKFDVVCSFQVLEHVGDPYKFIQSALECLKKKGLFIIAVPSESSFIKYARNSILNMPPHHITRWTDKALYSLSNLFPIDTIGVYHEKVSDIHKEWFVNTFIEVILFRKRKMINISNSYFKNNIIKLIRKMVLNKLKPEFLPEGHTVIAVYKKK